MTGTRFPVAFKPKLVHEALAKSFALDIKDIMLKFKLYHLTSAYEGKEIRSEDWNETFTNYLKEAARYKDTQEKRQAKIDYAPLKKSYVSQEQIDNMLIRMVKEGFVKYDGTLYKDKDNYVLAKPKVTKPQLLIDISKLSGLDRNLLEDLKRMYGHHYQETEKFKWFYARYTHPNYPSQRIADDNIMAELALEPNIGKRICELRIYLQKRVSTFFPNLAL